MEMFRMFMNADGAEGGETPTPAEVAKYTDSQLNDLIKKNVGKETEKAQASFLEKAGVKSFDELVELQKLRQAQMSETEKLNVKIKEYETSSETARREAMEARAEAEALKKGVPADKVEKVRKLALSGMYEGESVQDKINAVLDEFPEYIKNSPPANIGGATSNQAQDATSNALEQARKLAGLTK
jgi:hypothetical protein